MENLPSIGARCPRISGRKSGYVKRQLGGLSPLRGPLAAVAADNNITESAAPRASGARRADKSPRSLQQSERTEQPLLLSDVLFQVARERRAVAIIVARLEGILGDPHIGIGV